MLSNIYLRLIKMCRNSIVAREHGRLSVLLPLNQNMTHAPKVTGTKGDIATNALLSYKQSCQIFKHLIKI